MRLYKNVTKTLLAVKTPRRIAIDPGMIIDVDALGDISRSDIAMYIDRGVLVSVEMPKKASKKSSEVREVPTQGRDIKSTTEAAVENKTVVIRSTVQEEGEQKFETEVGRVSGSRSVAAVISAPPDTFVTMNPSQAPATKGAAFDALPPEVKENIAKVEAMIAKGELPQEAPKAKTTKKGAKKAKR